MGRNADRMTETDLQAYVDDELPADYRIEVESYLRRHMTEAAWVTAELRTREELRMALAESPCTPSGTTIDSARRLERAFIRDRTIRGLRRLAAVVAVAGLGWLAHAELGKLGISQVIASARPPAYVTDAVMAHRATIVRANLRSPSGATSYGPAEIRAATAIVMPTLPQGWKVDDVDIFPSSFGPSVEMVISAETLDPGTLFAVRPGRFDVVPATLTRKDEFTIAYWQVGEVAYALVAKADPRELERAANQLASSLH